jgi:hypothetical protein
MDKPNAVDNGVLSWHAIETFGEEQTLRALRKKGQTDQHVEAYRLAMEAQRGEQGAGMDRLKEIRTLSYAELKPRLSKTGRYWLSKWGKQASSENLEIAAHDLLAAQTPDRQRLYLRIFSETPFPLDHGPLLTLAVSDDAPVAVAAAAALANITHPSVRELAFRLVETRGAGREEAISMLDRNWQSGDHDIVLGWFEKEEDRDTRHGLGIDLRKSWEHHPDPASEARMLLTLYEKGPCSQCREFLLSRLIELESLPDSINEECACDANEDIRRLVGSHERSN